MSQFNKNRGGTGTREWSEHSFNIQQGCINNCIYCYAKSNALNKFKTIEKNEDWTKTTVNEKKANKRWNKLDGVIMFPTTHDIDENNVDVAIRALTNMLKPGKRKRKRR